MTRLSTTVMALALCSALGSTAVRAEQKPAPPPPPIEPAPAQPPPPPPAPARRPQQPATNPISFRGFATAGIVSMAAAETFEAVLGSSRGGIYGGGAQVMLPWGLYAEGRISRFRQDGERVIVGPTREIFPLGIATTVTLTPVELTGGWRHRFTRATAPRARTRRPTAFTAFIGAGLTSLAYRETAEFAEAGDDVDDRFTGAHVLGGLEYAATRWVHVGVEAVWTSIANAIGDGGVSAAFGENDLGGTTVRIKVSLGR